MAALADQKAKNAMATRWRRRQSCVLVGQPDAPAGMKSLSGNGIVLQTDARPAIGDAVALRHPEAGTITGLVHAHHQDWIALSLDGGEQAVAFAVAAIVADMSRPA